MTINLENQLGEHADELYNSLVSAHEGLSEEQSARLNVRLILLLMNQVGDASLIRQVLTQAVDSLHNA